MSSFTYLDSPTKAALLLITAVCTIFVFHADASLLNPDLIEKELKAFANHALGVDEMQVRAQVSLNFFLNAIKLLPILCAKERSNILYVYPPIKTVVPPSSIVFRSTVALKGSVTRTSLFTLYGPLNVADPCGARLLQLLLGAQQFINRTSRAN